MMGILFLETDVMRLVTLKLDGFVMEEMQVRLMNAIQMSAIIPL